MGIKNHTCCAKISVNSHLELTQVKCLTERFPLGKGTERKIIYFKGDCSLSLMDKNPHFYDGEIAPKDADFYFE